MRRAFCVMAFAGLALLPGRVSAAPIDLFQWVFNVDGTLYDSMGGLGSSALPPSFSLTPAATGAQGLLEVTISGAGAHDFVAFYDYDVNEVPNGFSNESGAVNGAPGAGLRWEIDEPGFVFGDIYNHIQGGSASLDNSNAVPAGSPDDVSVALGWAFILDASQTATISVLVSQVVPSGFYLAHFDPSGTNLYYSTSLAISGDGAPVPEPATLLLLGSGLVTAGYRRFRQVRSTQQA